MNLKLRKEIEDLQAKNLKLYEKLMDPDHKWQRRSVWHAMARVYIRRRGKIDVLKKREAKKVAA